MLSATLTAEAVEGPADNGYGETAVVILRFGDTEIHRWTTGNVRELLRSDRRQQALETFIADKIRRALHNHA